MPELPEVETVRRGLAPHLQGAVIARAEVRREGLRRPFPPRLAERLAGRRVLGLRRRAKYILIDLEGGESLLLHLGMSGRVRIDPAPGQGAGAGEAASAPGAFAHDLPALERHDHIVLHTVPGARVVLNDARRFGSLDLVGTEAAEAHPALAGLGPEPLGNLFHDEHLAAAFLGRRTPVKTALLDQRVVAGLGNIYVCEALHMSGIDPRRAAGDIAPAEAAALVPAVREVLEAAILAGGSTLRDHRRTDGELGYFQHSFRVYGREGAPCAAPGCDGRVARILQAGRSTFHCAACQR